jgi:hypothetical protein
MKLTFFLEKKNKLFLKFRSQMKFRTSEKELRNVDFNSELFPKEKKELNKIFYSI